MTHLEYNGWWNFETWLVNLWMGNDHGVSEYWDIMAWEAWNRSEPGKCGFETREFVSAAALAHQLEEYHYEQAGQLVNNYNVFADLLNAALSEVNWQQIAEYLIADVEKSELDATA